MSLAKIPKRKNKLQNKKIKNTQLSPNSFLKEFVFESNIKTNKHKKKVNEEDFSIPDYKEYNNVLNYNYNVSQLKQICSHYQLKKGGNKNELINRIYNYLYFSLHTIEIQKRFKGYLTRKMNILHGPAFFNSKMCVNESDFCSLEPLSEIPYTQFISIQVSSGHIYGFDICSLYNYIIKYQKNNHTLDLPPNPYDRTAFPETTIQKIKDFIHLSNVMNYKLNIKISNTLNFTSLKEKNKHNINLIFQKINELGNYSDSNWFLNLNRVQLVRFTKELYDIWNYRAQLSEENKLNICPGTGTPFTNTSFNMFYNLNIEQVYQRIIPILEKLLNSATNNEYKSLGAYYILSALTLVSNGAAVSMPWLYESVAYS